LYNLDLFADDNQNVNQLIGQDFTKLSSQAIILRVYGFPTLKGLFPQIAAL